MTTGHLVARLQLALNRDEHLDHLHHARRQIITAADFFDLVFKTGIQGAFLHLVLLVQGLNMAGFLVVTQGKHPPLAPRHAGQQVFGDFRIRLDAFGAFDGGLAHQHGFQTRIDVAIQDRQLIVTVARQAFDLFAFDLKRTFVFFHTMTVKDTHFDNRAVVTRFDPQRRVTHIGCFFTKDRAKKFFFRRHRAFTLRCDLADQNIARFDIRANINDPGFVKVAQGFLTDVGNVAGDLFWTQFGITCGDFEFLDVDRGINVITRDPLGNQDRVFVVVTIPGHERDDHVLAKGQFPHIRGRAVSDHFAFDDRIAHLHQRTLVDTGVLVGTLEFAHAIDVNARIPQFEVFGRADNDPLRINLVDDPCPLGHDGRAGIPCHDFFDPGADQRRLGPQQRNRLTLHVRSHQGAVRIVIFKERDQRCRNRHQLFGRNVNKINAFVR